MNRQVPSWPRLQATPEGKIVGPSGRSLSDFPDKDGYRRINTYEKGKWTQLSVHRLVCEAFHGPCPDDKTLVAHGNGDHSDNRPDNLRWATFVENEADKANHGTSLQGDRHHQAKLTEAQVLEIRNRRAAGESGKSLAKEFSVTPTQICNIHKRRSWSHL
jgi:hypothetical protein